MSSIAILGAGSWGTALAVIFSRAKKTHEITLWARSAAFADELFRRHENKDYLPGVTIPPAVRATHELPEALAGAQIVVGVIPSAYARSVYTQARPYFASSATFVSATKGLEPETHLRMSRVFEQDWKQTAPRNELNRFAVLSGTSFAMEAARGEPTAVVVATQDAALSIELQEQLAAPAFRLYTNDDVLGVELAGAMKNVMAIAAGACQGLGLGSNALAALITRGLAEMSRLAVKLGAKQETLSGLAGLGDLVLTCTGGLSRNRHVGIELGKGRALGEILANMQMVAEGVGTAAPLLALAREHQIDMPITEQVDAILHCGKSPKDAIRDIMERPLKRE